MLVSPSIRPLCLALTLLLPLGLAACATAPEPPPTVAKCVSAEQLAQGLCNPDPKPTYADKAAAELESSLERRRPGSAFSP